MSHNYYLVEVMCGHVGAGSYIPVIFPITAENGREAAKVARSIPRVKHDYKYAVLNVTKVGKEEFYSQMEENENDVYLNWRKTGCTEEYDFDVIRRIRHMDDLFVSKRKKERSRRSDPDYRGSFMHRMA